MKVILKPTMLILVPESDEDLARMEQWKTGRDQHVYAATENTGAGLSLIDLGPRDEACNVPLNVVSASRDPRAQQISNFALAPFTLDGREYQSVEAFWQGLKYEKAAERREVALLDGKAAMKAGFERKYGDTLQYEDRTIRVGTWEHWLLMEEACRAKFNQHEPSRAALLATGERPLIHRVRKDSKQIPGAIMAEIWMRIRRKLRHQEEVREDEGEEDA